MSGISMHRLFQFHSAYLQFSCLEARAGRPRHAVSRFIMATSWSGEDPPDFSTTE